MNFPKKLDLEDFDLIVKEWKLAGLEVDLYEGFAYIQIPTQGRAYVHACYQRTLKGYKLIQLDRGMDERTTPDGKLL